MVSRLNLVPYNSKVKEETKDLTDALVQVGDFSGQRELIEHMLAVLEGRKDQDPQLVEKAKKLVELTKGGN